jgi:hypothetical protein
MKNVIEFSSVMLAFALVTSFGVSAQANERFSIQSWQNSFGQAVKKNDSAAIKKLTDMKSIEAQALPKCVDCETKEKLSKARALFEKGDFLGAAKADSDITKDSDYWLMAIQEKGWAYFRNEDFEKTLAQTKTLLSPQFKEVADSESYLLQSLSQLRICDYEGVLKTDKNFKENQKSRVVAIQELAKTGANASLQDGIKQIDRFPLAFEDFGDKLTNLPLLFYRDIEFQKALLKIKISQAALSAMSVVGDNQPELQARYTQMKDDASEQLKNRLQKLAQIETQNNFKVIQKLNLVEVEAIQRIHTDSKLADSSYSKGDFKKVSEDQLVFMDDGQPWIDELDKYDVAAKTCPRHLRRKM